jgi:hypothetical protein
VPSNATDARMMSPAPGIADHSRLRTWRRSAASPLAATQNSAACKIRTAK